MKNATQRTGKTATFTPPNGAQADGTAAGSRHGSRGAEIPNQWGVLCAMGEARPKKFPNIRFFAKTLFPRPRQDAAATMGKKKHVSANPRKEGDHMGRQAKSAATLIGGAGHRTKAEIEARQNAERGIMSGMPMAEHDTTAANPAAHLMFQRVQTLLDAIGKNDAMYENCINRYCVMHAEALDAGREIKRYRDMAAKLDDERQRMQIEAIVRVIEQRLNRTRRMLMDIERENGLTVSSAAKFAARSASDDGNDDPMARLMRERDRQREQLRAAYGDR